MGSKPSERNAPEGGHDVAFDVAVVAGVGAGGEHDSLAGQPAVFEVGAETQRAGLVVAAVALGGEALSEAFGVCPLGARRMPTATLVAGDWVDAFVDHRVPPVALACDVAL